MMSTWKAIPERSSIVEPGADRRVDPFVEMDLVARVEEDAEERVAEVTVDDRLAGRRRSGRSRSAPYHSATASKYGPTSRST